MSAPHQHELCDACLDDSEELARLRGIEARAEEELTKWNVGSNVRSVLLKVLGRSILSGGGVEETNPADTPQEER